MGREARAIADWRGQTAQVKALLESHEIVLRGGIRARIPRSDVTAVATVGGRLDLLAAGEPLVLTLGEPEAGKWAAALLRPPPSLADKLGVSTSKRAFVTGSLADGTLRAALAGATTEALSDATLIVAVLEREADLDAAFAVAESAPHLAIWCVYPKGSVSSVGDSQVRNYLRERGYIDSKTSAVSDRLTATRYVLRKNT